jgi:CAAX prenyl protease-like protein
MLPYFIILLAYLITESSVFYLTKSIEAAILAKILVTGALLLYYNRYFRFRIKFDLPAILVGIGIAGIWIGLDSLYFHTAEQTVYYSFFAISLKLLAGVVIAPVIEEFFTRFFLIRWVIAKDYMKVALGKFTVVSFLVTVFFFGFSHDRWLAGLIAGVIFNLLFYYRKDIESCVLSHAIANLVLGIYVIYFGQWGFW